MPDFALSERHRTVIARRKPKPPQATLIFCCILAVSVLFLIAPIASAQGGTATCTINVTSPTFNQQFAFGTDVTVTANLTSTNGFIGTPVLILDGNTQTPLCNFTDLIIEETGVCSRTLHLPSPGDHTLFWQCAPNGDSGMASGFDTGTVPFSVGPGPTANLFPSFMILSLLYSPPGNASANAFSNSTIEGVVNTVANTFEVGTTTTVTDSLGPNTNQAIFGVTFGTKTTTTDSQSFAVTDTGITGNGLKPSKDPMNHYEDLFFLWVNPEVDVTQTGASTGSFNVLTPVGPDGVREPVDTVQINVAGLLNPNIIPLSTLKTQVLTDSNGNNITVPGLASICQHGLADNQCTATNACGCVPSDFAAIVAHDPIIYPFGASDPTTEPSTVETSPTPPNRYVFIGNGALQGPAQSGEPAPQNPVGTNDQNVTTQVHTEANGYSVGYSFGFKNGIPNVFSLQFVTTNTFSWTSSESVGVVDGNAHQALVTFGSSTPQCDENFGVYEDTRYHTFAFAPTAVPLANCLVTPPDFLLGVIPAPGEANQNVGPGGTATFGIGTLSEFGFTGNVSLSVSGLPQGASANFSPATLNLPSTNSIANSILTVNTTSATPAGSSLLTVTATSGSLSHTGTVGLSVVNNISDSLSPGGITFPAQNINTTSATQSVTLTNTNSGSVVIANINVNGDFAQTNNCPANLPPNASCTISVTFTPTANGSRNGNLSITDNAPLSPHTTALSGTGQTPAPATPGTGSVTINGNLQSHGPQFATGSISLSLDVGNASTCIDGNLIATINNSQAFTTAYGCDLGTGPVNTVAAAFAQSINGSNLVSATSSGSTVLIQSRTTGSNTNYALSAADQGPGFWYNVTTSGASLTGGTDTVFDSGTCSVTINGTQYSTNFGQGDTASSIAGRLANAISTGTLAKASAPANIITMTADQGGTASNYPYSSSCTFNSSAFGSPSFTTSDSGPNFTGGSNAVP